MLGDESWLNPLDDLPHAREMRRIEPVGAAERQARAVQRDRIVVADRVEDLRRRSAAHVVLGVHLEPRGGGTRFEDFLMVAETQPDPGPCRDRVASVSQRRNVRFQLRAPDQEAVVLPPWILEQSPAGSSTKDWESRALVACPAQECLPSAQSFLATLLMP